MAANDETEHKASDTIDRLFDYLNRMDNLTSQGDATAAALLAYGWWVRLVRTASALKLLHRAGFDGESAPLTRTLLHHAATLVWLSKQPDEVLAAVEYQHRHKAQKLAAGAITRQWDLSGVDKLPKKPNGPQPAGLAYLDQVEKLCNDMELTDLYVAYMIESGYVHPSANGADVYLQPADRGVVHLRTTSSLDGTPLRAVAVFALMGTWAFCSRIEGPTAEGLKRLVDQESERLGVDVRVRAAPHDD